MTHSRYLVPALLLLAACGSGGGASTEPSGIAGCDPADPATADACGTLLLGLTDADGDFLSYTVDVVSLSLTQNSGATVEVLPASTRIDFADYVDLTELVTASLVPPGAYVAGTITLDYGAADVFVEADGDARPATVVDPDGTPLGQATFRIELSDRDQLLITRGRPALLTVDFDLAASHQVDIAPTPALATAEPFILAGVDPVEQKDIRLRGLFLHADVDARQYTIALRPFWDRHGDFGRVVVNVTDETEFEVDGQPFVGIDGLRALEAAGEATPTVAQGTLDVDERAFTADVVLGGSSVPGADSDAVHGNIIARDGDTLTVRGATFVPSNAAATFRDDVIVNVGPDTVVTRHGSPGGVFSHMDLSIGQRVTVRGVAADPAADPLVIDATNGGIRMHLTHLAGTVNTVHDGQLDLALHAIDRRRVSIFDFAGTGTSVAVDADPDDYEVTTGSLGLDGQAPGKPVVVYGFPGAFGAAPPDFDGRTLVDYSEVRSLLGIGWGADGTTAPFLSMGGDGLVLDLANPDIDVRHHIRQGPVLIDLTSLPAGTLIVPRESGRTAFSIASHGGLRLYANFDDFVEALSIALDGATPARSMYARGLYDAETNIFTAWTAGVFMLEP